MVKVLELFSGTKSVGKICDELNWEVISLDLKDATINIDILDWDYKNDYKPKDFDIIWASPPCDCFSIARSSNLGRHIKRKDGKGMYILNKKNLQEDINNIGLPIVRKTQEIIDYFQPTFFFIENPQTGKMKNYLDYPFYDVDYCKYSDWGYRKRTRIWTNLSGFIPKKCKLDCDNIIPNTKCHKRAIGIGKMIMVDNKIKRIKGKEELEKYKDYPQIQNYVSGGGCKKTERYRIPPNLIKELFSISQKIFNLHLIKL